MKTLLFWAAKILAALLYIASYAAGWAILKIIRK